MSKSNVIEQFDINGIYKINIFGFDISFTNMSISLLITFIFILSFVLNYYINFKKKSTLIPSYMEVLYENFFFFIKSMVESNISKNEAKKYIALIFSIFIFIFFSNILSILNPFMIGITTHIITNFTIGFIVFSVTLYITIKKHGIFFYRAFIPHGTPLWMYPLIFILEFFTYLSKPITLAVRLMANIMAGHIIMEIIAGFVIMLGIFGILPFIFLFILCGYEIFAASLQAYIFALLSSVYISQAIEH